jgi:putative ABC transport system permease protein
MWSLALRTLIADRGKLVTAMVGVVFSIVLMNVQGGLFLGLLRRASLLVDFTQADIWVGHKAMHNVDFTRDIPRRWRDRILGTPGVATAKPYIIGHTEMTLPSGGYEDVVVVGSDRASVLGGAWNVSDGDPSAIRQADGVIVDEFEADKLEFPAIGDTREIGGRRARIVAHSRGIVGFLVTPYVFTTLQQASLYLEKPPEQCSYFLVKLSPDADADTVCRAIRQRLPEVEAYPRGEYAWLSINYWLTRTGLGISFGAATLLGLLVGAVIVAQTLYASVLDRLSEFGTLKAMGARESQIFTILLVQASVMAIGGAGIGLELVLVIERSFSTPHAPILIPASLSLASCAVVLAICVAASLLPYVRIRKVDPAIVLRG